MEILYWLIGSFALYAVIGAITAGIIDGFDMLKDHSDKDIGILFFGVCWPLFYLIILYGIVRLTILKFRKK